MNPEEFRRYGHQLVDWIADYRAGVEQRPVMSQSSRDRSRPGCQRRRRSRRSRSMPCCAM